jgi:hypothetical protein
VKASIVFRPNTSQKAFSCSSMLSSSSFSIFPLFLTALHPYFSHPMQSTLPPYPFSLLIFFLFFILSWPPQLGIQG